MHQDENDDTIACHLGTRVRKNHTSKRGAFQTIGDNPAFHNCRKSNSKKYFTKNFFEINEFQSKINLDTKVALVKYHPGYDPEFTQSIN